ncbi:hypothetical protein VVR12_01675 [Rothia sp. LK2588]|uniref:hypothetical protein n=1 Tax=Rothia sp. LK2588 TaxID=3114369 RepID=UPI0034CFF9A2
MTTEQIIGLLAVIGIGGLLAISMKNIGDRVAADQAPSLRAESIAYSVICALAILGIAHASLTALGAI